MATIQMLSKNRALQTLLTYLLTSSVCIVAIVRIYFIVITQWSDPTFSFIELGIWISIECNIGIVSACLPILRPVIQRLPSPPAYLDLRRLSWRRLSNGSRVSSEPKPKVSDGPIESDATKENPGKEKTEKKPGLWTLQLEKADEDEDETFDSRSVKGGEAKEKDSKQSSTKGGESLEESQHDRKGADDAVTRMV